MINPKTKERELCFITKIDAIEPIVGSDNCEAAVVGGWRVMTRKGTFQPGDLAVYFEIDSKVPETETFEFLAKKHYKIKTQKYTFGGKGNFISQGLLMAPEDFGWEKTIKEDGSPCFVTKDNQLYQEGDFLTQVLGVTYSVLEDNKRKGSGPDKYKKMAARHPKIFKQKWAKWLMQREWGKKLMFVFFGKKKDKAGSWPVWVVKTDEERVQNLAHMIPDFCKEKWYATEKIDGSSTTFTIKGHGRKEQFLVCSRNVAFDKPDKKCYYDTNIYTEMAEKYDMYNVLKKLMEANPDAEFITIQGETFGEGVQRRTYGLKEHDFRAFNLIIGTKDGVVKRANPQAMTDVLALYNVPCVPIVGLINLPPTCDEILAAAAGPSAIDGDMREGLVFRSEDGARSFKAVDNGFLIKFHG